MSCTVGTDGGWFKAPRAVFADADLNSSAKLVLLALKARANDDGVCWPSIDTIRADTSLGEAAVYSARKRLKARGYISWRTRKRRPGDAHQPSSVYRILPLPSIPGFGGTAGFKGAGAAPSDRGGHPRIQGGERDLREREEPPSAKSSKKKTRKAKKAEQSETEPTPSKPPAESAEQEPTDRRTPGQRAVALYIDLYERTRGQKPPRLPAKDTQALKQHMESVGNDVERFEAALAEFFAITAQEDRFVAAKGWSVMALGTVFPKCDTAARNARAAEARRQAQAEGADPAEAPLSDEVKAVLAGMGDGGSDG